MKKPANGKSRDEILGTLKEYKKMDVDWRDGKVFGYVFHASEEATQMVEDAFNMFIWENALDPTVFKSLLRMETEVVAMCAAHLGGDENTAGSFTSGGTESVLLAVKTARDWARENRPEIKEPEMILPVSAHACFHKAAQYFNVKPVVIPVDPKTFKVDLDKMKAAINENTILMVGSAPSYAQGVVDPIREIAAMAQERGILCHVDGCIGGFLLPYFKKLGGKVTDFDFSVPGVTSISMDLHKYAFAAKGASVILYKTKELRKYQIFTCSTWSGYTVVNPTIQSSKSGGPVAGAWAVLNYLGDDGYLEVTRKLKDATDKYKEGIAKLPDFYVQGEPEMSLVAVTSDTLNIFEVVDEMLQRGWHIQIQPGVMGTKENFHVTIMPQTTPNIEALLKDLAEVADVVRNKPKSELVQQMTEFAANLKPEDITDEGLKNMLAMAGIGGGEAGVPERMAELNEILNSLPREVVDKILKNFFNELSHYRGQ
jgi:glutamate/tyrosine decarboxylase-like PLP-dependent enzyme